VVAVALASQPFPSRPRPNPALQVIQEWGRKGGGVPLLIAGLIVEDQVTEYAGGDLPIRVEQSRKT